MNDLSHRRTLSLPQLCAAERLFIWGFRSAAQQQRLGWPTATEIRQVYDHFRVSDAVASLDALLEVFACTAHTAIELHCPGCRCASSGEHGLLQAVAAAQCGQIELARQRFAQWLPAVAVEWALAPARGLATTFRMAGLTLPDRSASTFEHEATMTMQSWPIGSGTLH